MPSIPQKTCQLIVDSGNHYLATLKASAVSVSRTGNQPTRFKSVQAHFVPPASFFELRKGHGRIEKRTVSICTLLIGSEAVESTIKQIDRWVQISGAQWEAENVPQVLAHCATYLNGFFSLQ